MLLEIVGIEKLKNYLEKELELDFDSIKERINFVDTKEGALPAIDSSIRVIPFRGNRLALIVGAVIVNKDNDYYNSNTMLTDVEDENVKTLAMKYTEWQLINEYDGTIIIDGSPNIDKRLLEKYDLPIVNEYRDLIKANLEKTIFFAKKITNWGITNIFGDEYIVSKYILDLLSLYYLEKNQPFYIEGRDIIFFNKKFKTILAYFGRNPSLIVISPNNMDLLENIANYTNYYGV